MVQVALATALLLCGGLLVQSLMRLLDVPLGFEPRNVLSMEITLPGTRYATPEARGRFFDALLEEAASIPGIESISGCTLLPFGYGENVNSFEIVGQPKPPAPSFALINNVLPGYFETLHIPLLRGRYLTTQDRRGSEPVAVIDDTLAQQVFAGLDPIGQQVKVPWGTFMIAGIVGGVKNTALDVQDRPTIYFSGQQTPTSDSTLVIRSQLPVNTIEESVQRTVARIDPDEPVYNVILLQTFIDRSVKTRRIVASATSVFAGAGIALAAVGLFGLLSYVVALRRREIGIRMAVGASGQAIALLVCRGGMPLVATGATLGGLAAGAAYHLIANQLYGIQFKDAWTWSGGPRDRHNHGVFWLARCLHGAQHASIR